MNFNRVCVQEEKEMVVNVYTELSRSFPESEHGLSISENGTEGDSSSF